MAGEIHHVAAQLGQASPGGRLDPPLLMALDEIVQTCPVPLPTWLADSGGKGIQLIPVAHGEAQLRTRWQQDGAQVVLDTCGVKIWLPGISDTATLQDGQRPVRPGRLERTRPGPSTRRHDVMTPDMIRQLPAGHALIVRGGYAPVLARLGVAWKDRAYKPRPRRGTAVATLPPAPPSSSRSDDPATSQAGLADLPAPLPGDRSSDTGRVAAAPATTIRGADAHARTRRPCRCAAPAVGARRRSSPSWTAARPPTPRRSRERIAALTTLANAMKQHAR